MNRKRASRATGCWRTVSRIAWSSTATCSAFTSRSLANTSSESDSSRATRLFTAVRTIDSASSPLAAAVSSSSWSWSSKCLMGLAGAGDSPEPAADERLGARVLWVGEQLGGRPLFDQLAEQEEHGAIGDTGRLLDVVRDQ